MSITGRQFLACALATAAVVAAACAGSDPSGPTATSHRYAIDLTANLVAGNLCQWSYTDHGSLMVDISGNEGSVSNIINTQATLSMTSCNSTCTEELVNQPRGPIDIFEVMSVGENPQTGQVAVAFNARPESPEFKDTCAGVVTTVGGATATIPSSISFYDNGASQATDFTDSVTGQSIHVTVTPQK